MLLLCDESMSIDGGEIDRDHRYLFELCNRIGTGIRSGLQKHKLLSLFDEYLNFLAIHFSHEEALMTRIGFPETARHIKAHNILFDQACEIRRQYEQNGPNLQPRLASHLAIYAFRHIDTEDRKLAEFCFSRSAAFSALNVAANDRHKAGLGQRASGL